MTRHSPDCPGTNLELQPGAAPEWMRGLIEAVHAGATHADIPRINRERPRTTGPDPRRGAPGSAVLVAISGSPDAAQLPENAEVLLTHRSSRLRSHSGQIAFPGGRIDPADRSPVDTAFREAWEETGLDRHAVTPLVRVHDLYVRTSQHPIHPVIGHWHTPGGVGVVEPEEADEVMPVPLRELIDPRNRLLVGKAFWEGPAFRIDDYLIWGFTAGVLASIIRTAGWEDPWDDHTVHDLSHEIARSRNNERSKPTL